MRLVLLSLLSLLPLSANAWDGVLRGSGDDIEIDNRGSINEGDTIKYYDHKTVEDYEAEVETIEDSGGGGTDITVIDNDTGKKQVLEME